MTLRSVLRGTWIVIINIAIQGDAWVPKYTEISGSFLPGNNDNTSMIQENVSLTTLQYSIFSGHSVLRELPPEWRQRLQYEWNTTTKATWTLELLASGFLDAAHEILLGVSWQEMDDAEYAATHRGKTNWTRDHPLDETDDFLHSIIHRLEGSQIGEGGYTGYENAKYWIAGGPKEWKTLPTNDHPVYTMLSEYTKQVYPDLACQLISTEDRSHSVMNRSVLVVAGSWDGIALLNLWDHSLPSLQAKLYDLHNVELKLWRRYLQQSFKKDEEKLE